MKTAERERNDWIVIVILIGVGFLLLLAAGQMALRFAASWQLDTSMDSHLDPNSAFLTRRPSGSIEPVDSSILTLPSWIDSFLTPGVVIVTGTPFPLATSTIAAATTAPPPTSVTAAATLSPTATLVYSPPTWTATSRPGPTATSPVTGVPTSLVTLTSTSVPPITGTPSPTQTPTATWTTTATSSVTSTPTSTPVPIPTDPIPPEIGTIPDGVTYDLTAGGTLTLGLNLIANGDAGYDFVYYEFAAASGILMDWAIVEIGDGTNWYTVFYWGNDIADTNSNMDFNLLPNPVDPPEQDQRDVPSSALYNLTGIAIDIDSIVPPGTYSYIRFTAPTGDADNQMEIDAIEILP